MTDFLAALDQRIRKQGPRAAWALAVLGVIAVGSLDYATGYEVSMSLFYLAPVGVAAWYGSRSAGIAVAVISCASWYFADRAAGHPYSHPGIPVWNAAIRLGFFLVTALLLATMRGLLLNLWHLARTDALTGLFGRRAFEDRLEHDLSLAQRHGSALTLVYMDVDDFKSVNDAHGHARGDRLLQTTGRVLKGSIRRADTAARLGGDEFALILPDTDQHGARHLIETLSRKLETALSDDGLKVTFSTGAVTFQKPIETVAEAVAAADALMYAVKREVKGASRFRVVDGSDQRRDTPRLFAYGTLQQEDVQLSTFGRRLVGQADELPGFEQSWVAIEDAQVVATSGKTHHPIVRFNGNAGSRVAGTVFEVSDAELALADRYEVSSYRRVAVRLASGRQAWVYVDALFAPPAADGTTGEDQQC